MCKIRIPEQSTIETELFNMIRAVSLHSKSYSQQQSEISSQLPYQIFYLRMTNLSPIPKEEEFDHTPSSNGLRTGIYFE